MKRHWFLFVLAVISTVGMPACISPAPVATEPTDVVGEARPPAVTDDGNSTTDEEDDERWADEDASYPEEDEISIFSRRPEQIMVEFEVFRIIAPAGTFDESSPIWEIASAGLSDVSRNLRLKANGFLVAVGRKSDRELLVEYLENLKRKQVISDRVTPDASRLLDIELGRRTGRFSLFRYDEGGTLRGVEFESPLPRLRMRTEFRSTNLRNAWLELMPQLEEPAGPAKWVVADGKTPELKPQERKHSFDELAFGVEVPEGGFLLIGPSKSIQDRPLLARAFFLDANAGVEDGPRKESAFIIRPIIRTTTIEPRKNNEPSREEIVDESEPEEDDSAYEENGESEDGEGDAKSSPDELVDEELEDDEPTDELR